MSSTKAKKLSYEAYLALPETKERYDIVDGVMLMPPGPTPSHQWYMQQIFIKLWNFVEAHSVGVVLVAPVDLLVQREPRMMRDFA